jgi:hypothetical protein
VGLTGVIFTGVLVLDRRSKGLSLKEVLLLEVPTHHQVLKAKLCSFLAMAFKPTPLRWGSLLSAA